MKPIRSFKSISLPFSKLSLIISRACHEKPGVPALLMLDLQWFFLLQVHQLIQFSSFSMGMRYLRRRTKVLLMGRFLYLFLLVVMMSFSTSGQSKSAIANFQKAKEAFKQNNEEKGWAYLERPSRKAVIPITNRFLLVTAGLRKDVLQSIAYYDRALQIQELSSIHLKKSIVYKYAGEFDLAIDSYQLYMKNVDVEGTIPA